MREKVKNALMELGANPANKGFRYTVEAVVLINEDSSWLDKITGLYTKVASIGDASATGSRVERAIRHMIEGISANSSLGVFQKYFPSNHNGKITNSMFLASLYYNLRQEEKPVTVENYHECSNKTVIVNGVVVCRSCAEKLLAAILG